MWFKACMWFKLLRDLNHIFSLKPKSGDSQCRGLDKSKANRPIVWKLNWPQKGGHHWIVVSARKGSLSMTKSNNFSADQIALLREYPQVFMRANPLEGFPLFLAFGKGLFINCLRNMNKSGWKLKIFHLVWTNGIAPMKRKRFNVRDGKTAFDVAISENYIHSSLSLKSLGIQSRLSLYRLC